MHSWTLGAAYFYIFDKGNWYLSKPEALNIVKTLFFRDVVDDDDGMCPLVICTCDGSESLLSCSVPDL